MGTVPQGIRVVRAWWAWAGNKPCGGRQRAADKGRGSHQCGGSGLTPPSVPREAGGASDVASLLQGQSSLSAPQAALQLVPGLGWHGQE